MDESGQVRRMPLIDEATVRRDFTSLAFADSHGAFGAHLGAGLLYYALAQMVRSQVTVCIGSGGGFVPALLRRAQLDAGIDPAATYLVDANLPDLAFGSPVQLGGWMTEENPFLVRESDIGVLPMLSADAVRLFAAQGLRIDYLHIDGDHSRDGMLADFRDYAPLITSDGIVTVHDLAMPSIAAGLAIITSEFPEWEQFGFPEIGAGTALLRRRRGGAVQRRPQGEAPFVDATRDVALRREPLSDALAESRRSGRFERWKYLATPAYRLRYRLLLAEIDQPDVTIVEIGGYPNSVVEFTEHARRVHAIEPYATPDYIERVEALSRRKAVTWFRHPVPLSASPLRAADLGAFNLLALGLDLGMGEEDVDAMEQALRQFARLLASARRAVVEIARHPPADTLWEALAAALQPRTIFDLAIDLRQDPVADLVYVKDDRALRRMLLLEGVACPDIDAPAVRSALRLAAERVIEAREKASAPVVPDYALGTTILFNAGGTSDSYVRSGWIRAEPRHRWSSGPDSDLVLKIAEDTLAAASAFMLHLIVEPLVVPGVHESQRLAVAINGHTIHEGTLASRAVLAIPLPRALLVERPLASFRFTHPDFRRPADLIPGNRDQKPLAFRFFELAIRAE